MGEEMTELAKERAAQKAEFDEAAMTFGDKAVRLYENYGKPIGRDMMEFITSEEVVTAPVKGLQDAAKDIAGTIDFVARAVHDPAERVEERKAKGEKEGEDGTVKDKSKSVQSAFIPSPELIPGLLAGEQRVEFPELKTGTGEMVREITRFGAEAAPVIAGAQTIGIPSIMAWGLGAGAAGFVRDPAEPNMADMLKEVGELDNDGVEAVRSVWVDALARDEDDSEFVKRLKAGAEEGTVLGVLPDTVIEGLRLSYRAARSALASGTAARVGRNLLDSSARKNELLRLGAELSDDEVKIAMDERRIGRILTDADAAYQAGLDGKAVAAPVIVPAVMLTEFDNPNDPPDAKSDLTAERIINVGLGGKLLEQLIKKTTKPGVEALEEKVIKEATEKAAMKEAGQADLLKQKYGLDPAVEAKAEGIDFNFDRIEADEDVKGVIDRVSEHLAPEIEAYKRGKRSLSEIEHDASLMNMSVDDVMAMRTTNAEEFTAARFALVTSATKLRNMAAHIAGPDSTDRDMIAFRRAIQDHSVLQMHVKGQQTEIARALSAMRITAKAMESDDVRMVEQFIVETGGRGGIKRMASKLASTTDPAHFNRVASKMGRITRWDMFLEVWYASLLSNPMTHVVNTVTSGFATAVGLPEMASAAMAGTVRRALGGEGGVYAGNVLDYGVGMIGGIRTGMRNGWETLRTGEPQDAASKFEGLVGRRRALTSTAIGELPEMQALKGVLPQQALDGMEYAGKAFDVLTEIWPRGVTRLMMTADQANKGIAYTAMLNSRAASKTREGVLNGTLNAKEARAMYNGMVQNPETFAPDLHMESARFGQEMTFQLPLGQKGQKIMSAIRTIPGSALVFPFMKTPANILKYVTARTPAAPLLKEFREAVTGSDPFARDLAMGRMALGSSIGFSMVSVAGAGYITGGGPIDFRLRKSLENTGWQPYSILIPKDSAAGQAMGLKQDRHISYKRFDPFSQFLGISADMHEVWGYATEDEQGLMASVISTAIYRNITSRTWMTGFSDLMESTAGMETGNLSPTERLLTRIAASAAVPSGARWIGTTEALGGDPTRRSTRPEVSDPETLEDIAPAMQWLDRMVKSIKARTGQYSEELPPIRNFWGKEQVLTPGVLINTVPIFTRESTIDTGALKAAGISPVPHKWARLRHPYDMDDAQHLAFVQAAGVDGEIVRLGNPMGYHPNKIGGVEMNPDEMDAYVVAANTIRPESGSLIVDGRRVMDYAGMNLHQAMTGLVQTPEYRAASDLADISGSKISLLRKVTSFYRHDANPDRRTGLGGADLMAATLHPTLMQRIQLMRVETQSIEKLLEAQ